MSRYFSIVLPYGNKNVDQFGWRILRRRRLTHLHQGHWQSWGLRITRTRSASDHQILNTKDSALSRYRHLVTALYWTWRPNPSRQISQLIVSMTCRRPYTLLSWSCLWITWLLWYMLQGAILLIKRMLDQIHLKIHFLANSMLFVYCSV